LVRTSSQETRSHEFAGLSKQGSGAAVVSALTVEAAALPRVPLPWKRNAPVAVLAPAVFLARAASQRLVSELRLVFVVQP
jgi:hypothetical protein